MKTTGAGGNPTIRAMGGNGTISAGTASSNRVMNMTTTGNQARVRAGGTGSRTIAARTIQAGATGARPAIVGTMAGATKAGDNHPASITRIHTATLIAVSPAAMADLTAPTGAVMNRTAVKGTETADPVRADPMNSAVGREEATDREA